MQACNAGRDVMNRTELSYALAVLVAIWVMIP
jgi:hypothetical protein